MTQELNVYMKAPKDPQNVRFWSLLEMWAKKQQKSESCMGEAPSQGARKAKPPKLKAFNKQ